MRSHFGRGAVAEERDGIERLVEAERVWQESLEAARAEGERIVAAAEAAAAAAEQAFEASIPQLIAGRRRETQAANEADVKALLDELARHAFRYSEASDAVVQDLAERIAASAPWVCTFDSGDDS
jgi:hypothetical protein